jgi:hypothetical protein
MADRRAKIVQTLKKLLAHQRSAEDIGSREEALAFASRIAELTREFHVAQSELEDGDQEDFTHYGTSAVDWYEDSTEEVPWQAFLFNIIATAHACQSVFVRDDARKRFFVVGQDIDRAVTCALGRQLVKSIDILGEDAAALDSAVAYGACTVADYMTSYRIGFMQALQERLTEDEAAAQIETKALIAISRAVTRTEKYLQQRVGVKGETTAMIEMKHNGAAQQGYEDGMAADLEANRIGAGRPAEKKEIAQ